MIVRLKIAGRVIEIRTHHELIVKNCKHYLLSEDFSDPPDIRIETSQKELIETYKHLNSLENSLDYSKLCIDHLESIVIFRKIADAMLSYDTLLIHGAAVATAGQGYLLTADSGVGKTTRSRLWIDNIPGSIVVNGDKPLIHISDESVTLYGTPWCGKEHWNTNVAVPLRAIFFLERAEEGEADVVEELGTKQAILMLGPQTHEPAGQNSLLRIMHLLWVMANNVKCYRLRCAPTAEAVRMAWQAARPKE